MGVTDGLLAILPVTASTLTIALVLLVLLNDQGLRAGVTLVSGWFAGAWAVLLLAMVGVLTFVPSARDGMTPSVQLAVGVVSLGIGSYILWRVRRHGASSSNDQARMARLADSLTPARSGALGFALAGLSPRQWVFLVPAAATFAASSVPASVVVLPLAGAGVATLGVGAPVALAAAVRRRRPDILHQVRRQWLRHGEAVGGGAAVVIGLLFLYAAVTTG
jgi:threonine/homoserine/homoserine lactone efflux protein